MNNNSVRLVHLSRHVIQIARIVIFRCCLSLVTSCQDVCISCGFFTWAAMAWRLAVHVHGDKRYFSMHSRRSKNPLFVFNLKLRDSPFKCVFVQPCAVSCLPFALRKEGLLWVESSPSVSLLPGILRQGLPLTVAHMKQLVAALKIKPPKNEKGRIDKCSLLRALIWNEFPELEDAEREAILKKHVTSR